MKPIILIYFLLLFILPDDDQQLYKDVTQPLEHRVENLISLLTLDEKISLCHGNSNFNIAAIERLGIPSWSLSDGPHGVREEINPHSWDPVGWTTDSATYFPTSTALAATWNPELAFKVGHALGEEARARNKDVLLGPGINIHRTPLCGRNFEYMSEDPFLISKMAVPYIKGVQQNEVAACVKHFALNNQEYERKSINVEVDERALREIYLPGFKAAVEEGGVLTLMTAYNKFRGEYCSANTYLLNDILKGEWAFEGVVLSDWDGTHSTVKSALAGLDLEMGTVTEDYNDYYFAEPLYHAIQEGQLNRDVLDDKVRRILRVMLKTNVLEHKNEGALNTTEHQLLARQVAREAVVLLKNDRGLLPLDKNQVRSVVVIGDNATRVHASGGFSSGLKALYEITPLRGLRNLLKDDIRISFVPGYKKSSVSGFMKRTIQNPDAKEINKLIDEAVLAAKKSDVAIIFGGLNHDYDTEGLDREELKLPYGQDQLINAVCTVNPNTIVVLISGSSVEMGNWINKVPSLIQAWYAGMEGGNAIAEVLFGHINPSGKLPFTFPKKLADSPAHVFEQYPGSNGMVSYDEGIFVGYRYYDTKNVDPLFCFGHGLSYTNFEYSDLNLSKSSFSAEDSLLVSIKIRNDGEHNGAEVVQVYIQDIESSVERPLKELKNFKKIYLDAGEDKRISFTINSKDLAFYDVDKKDWTAEAGMYYVLIGSSSRDIRIKSQFELK